MTFANDITVLFFSFFIRRDEEMKRTSLCILIFSFLQTEYKYCYDLVLHYVLHYLNKDMNEKK